MKFLHKSFENETLLIIYPPSPASDMNGQLRQKNYFLSNKEEDRDTEYQFIPRPIKMIAFARDIQSLK